MRAVFFFLLTANKPEEKEESRTGSATSRNVVLHISTQTIPGSTHFYTFQCRFPDFWF